FSYGAVLYEMVSGKRAFTETGEALNREILERPPAALIAKSPVHFAIESVLAGCLVKEPAARRQRIQNAVIELKLAGCSMPPVTAKSRELPPERRPLAASEAEMERVLTAESVAGRVRQPIFGSPQMAPDRPAA